MGFAGVGVLCMCGPFGWIRRWASLGIPRREDCPQRTGSYIRKERKKDREIENDKCPFDTCMLLVHIILDGWLSLEVLTMVCLAMDQLDMVLVCRHHLLHHFLINKTEDTK
eukprot:TRINITY_DN35211_c0_g2_i1.p1 TRINITY_DN35211_c0_g2~~TRINITY_DN35211_c0_g2_i1.p1  ORF type:complete len:126 (+),score=19.07 TRINITY_DN35211_c0_g2_i1:46-378(+)